MAAAGELALGGHQLGGARRLLVDFLLSEACDLASCEVSLPHYTSVAQRLRWLEPKAAWSIGEAEGVQVLALPLDRDEESRLWRVSWRPDGSEWLTTEDLVSDMKELHLGDGVVIVWPQAVKQEAAEDAAEHEAQLEARLSRPIRDVIVIECAAMVLEPCLLPVGQAACMLLPADAHSFESPSFATHGSEDTKMAEEAEEEGGLSTWQPSINTNYISVYYEEEVEVEAAAVEAAVEVDWRVINGEESEEEEPQEVHHRCAHRRAVVQDDDEEDEVQSPARSLPHTARAHCTHCTLHASRCTLHAHVGRSGKHVEAAGRVLGRVFGCAHGLE